MIHEQTILAAAITILTMAACTREPPAHGDTSTTSSSSDSSTSTSEGSESGTSETGGPSCVELAYACQEAADTASSACFAACNADLRTCEDEACRWSCVAERDTQYQACADMHCPTDSEAPACEVACHVEAAACATEPSCTWPGCTFAEIQCMVATCHPCEVVQLPIPYAGSCEIVLPGSTPSVKANVTYFELDANEFGVVDAIYSCDMPYVGANWFDSNYDRIVLCPTQCDSFALAGELNLVFGIPPCE